MAAWAVFKQYMVESALVSAGVSLAAIIPFIIGLTEPVGVDASSGLHPRQRIRGPTRLLVVPTGSHRLWWGSGSLTCRLAALKLPGRLTRQDQGVDSRFPTNNNTEPQMDGVLVRRMLIRESLSESQLVLGLVVLVP